MFLKKVLAPTPGKRQRAGESGQALIETAITLALLVVILLGAAELGSIAYAAIQVVNAAKAAVQYGDQNHRSASDVTGMQTAAALEAPALTDLNTVVSHSCICSDGSASTCALTDCPNSIIEETLQVQTSASFTPFIHLPGLPSTLTLNGQAIQKVLSND